ncbi:hypothetical protein B0O99DRAFT_659317 [Bisporella sp. PMI_857]|nr:hypothetical protein B0O99DRAFT_659317 [Bisporella sp. PMI_857]
MDVIPVPLTDQQTPVNNIRTRTFFVLDDQLDEAILKNALASLIREHWRKLGGRLATGKNGHLEYHVPHTFGENYLLFDWTSKAYNHSIDNITDLPRATHPEAGITFHPHLAAVESWFRPAHWPYERKDEPADAPLLYVQFSSFTDATVLAISAPHVLGDQFGLGNILKAWLGMVRGVAPPSMIGYDDDIVFNNGKLYNEYSKKERKKKGRMRIILEKQEVTHTVFLPHSLLQALRARVVRDLAEEKGGDPGISVGDIITGIMMKFARMHVKKSKRLTLSQTVNLRGRIPQLENRDAFIHNSLHYATSRFLMTSSTPMGEIALRNRQAIIRATVPKEIEIGMETCREMVFEWSYNISNWSAAWKGLDFGEAVKGENKGRNPKLKLLLGEGKALNGPDRFNAMVLCKAEEGYWCRFSAAENKMKLLEEYVKEDPMLERL